MKLAVEYSGVGRLSFLVALLLSGCATTMQMPPEELKKLQPNEGVVIGSVQIKGGKDLLGRTRWNLVAKRNDNAGSEYSMVAHREGNEEYFTTRMAAGEYRIYKMYQDGFSKFTSPLNVQFKVETGKTKYLGKLVIEFPPEFLTIGTAYKIMVDDAKEKALEYSEKVAGLSVNDVATDLLTPQYRTSCLTGPLSVGVGSITVAVTPGCQ